MSENPQPKLFLALCCFGHGQTDPTSGNCLPAEGKQLAPPSEIHMNNLTGRSITTPWGINLLAFWMHWTSTTLKLQLLHKNGRLQPDNIVPECPSGFAGGAFPPDSMDALRARPGVGRPRAPCGGAARALPRRPSCAPPGIRGFRWVPCDLCASTNKPFLLTTVE